MKDNHSQKTTGASSVPAAQSSNGGISAQPPAAGIFQLQPAIEPDPQDAPQRTPEQSWPLIQQKKQWTLPVVQQKEIPTRFNFSARAPIQMVGGLGNNANDCFLNAVIQLIEKSYDDLFNPNVNKVNEARQPVQTAMWLIITDLRADKIVPKETVGALRKDLNGKGLVADCTSQEDAQELMIKIIDYMIEGSVNNYPYGEGGHLLHQSIDTSSDDKAITGDVAAENYTSEPAKFSEHTSEIGNGLIGIDINIYHSFEEFLFFLYGQGTTTTLAPGEETKVLKDSKQVYVNARTEKRSFLALPNVLTFYVKRFIGRQKITDDFPMPETVILVEDPGTDQKQYKTYTLEVVVRHTGDNTLDGGHYYATKKNEAGEATRYSDTTQEKVTDKSDLNQGSLYSYRLSGTKDLLDEGEMAWQETRPPGARSVPNTKGVPLPKPPDTGSRPSGNGPAPVKGGGFSPFLGVPPVAHDKIRGLPNRSREVIPGDKRMVDCFINAILQLIAGAYRDLFDPSLNPLSDPASTEIQAAVRVLIQKINSEDTTPIAENEISTLRGLLLKHKGVSSLFTQEDGGELMMFMLGLMLDVTGKDLDLPKEKEDDAEATIIAANNKPGAIAAVHKTSLERLVRKNPVLKDHQVTVTRRERVIKKNLAEPSTLPDLFRNNAAVKTQWEEESEPLGNVIPVDIGETSDFEEFLFQRYGKGWETENFSTDNHAKYTMDVNGQKRNVAFKSRQKQYRFSNLPPTLSFLVKRFTGDKSSQKKEMRNYALPPQLILVEISGGDQKRYKHYELKGIVVHTGDSINKGHYYTHRKEGKDWVKANDRNVWKEDSPGADLQQGYIYTYQLKYESDALQPGQQAPQEKYDLPATIYLADSKLRPTDAMGFATDPKHRNTQAQSAVSGEINDIIKAFFPETEGVYHAGHLFTSTLGGTGDARNLTPMWDNYNSGSGGYKDFEDKRLTGLLNEAKENQRLYIAIHATYPADDTPEQVFQGLLSTEDIALLVAWYTKGVPVYNKKLAAATTPEEKQEFRKKLEIAKGVQNFYPHFIRVCRRIPLQMYNREARLITVEGSGAFLSRGPNQRFNISGSPRHMLGALDLDYFIDEREESLAPYTRLYGGQQSIDLKGQDPDEWAVKTYADMPEPGVFNYITIDGRAAGVDAYIWMDPEGIFSTYKFGGGTEDAGPAPEGFDWRLLNQARRHGKTKLYARAHLLNGKLHGSGNDPKNLSPFTQDANKKMSKEFEEKVKQLPALTTPGKGIFWVSRLTGTVKRSGLFNTKLAEKQAALPLTTDRWKKDSLEMQIALAEEEARMFGGIHFFAYEADVQKDGSLKKGKLLLSAYFENCFSGESGTLGDTSYNSLFAKREKGAALLQLGFSSEREALKNLSAAIGEEHKNANETYIKSAPAMAKDSPAFKFETAANDIQATLNEQLPLYYAAYQTHLKNLADVTNWNKQIATFNRKVAGLANLPAKTWQVAYDEVIDSGKELKKTVSGYGKCLAHYLQLVEWYKSLKLMAVQHHLLTGKVADYSAIKKTKLTTLKDLKPAKLRKLTSIRTPKTRETTPDASPRPKKKAKKDTGSSDKSK